MGKDGDISEVRHAGEAGRAAPGLTVSSGPGPSPGASRQTPGPHRRPQSLMATPIHREAAYLDFLLI